MGKLRKSGKRFRNRRAIHGFCAFFGFCLSISFGTSGERVWHDDVGFRWAALEVSANGKTGFSLLRSDRTGISITNLLDEVTSASRRVLMDGSGVAVGDFD